MSQEVVIGISDPRLRSLFSLLLTDYGATVVTCQDPDEILRLAVNRPFKLIVLSNDAGTDPAPVISSIRRLAPETHLLMLTRREDIESILPLFSLGLNDALLQPVNPKRAMQAIQKLMAAPAATTSHTNTSGQAEHLVARSTGMRTALQHLAQACHDPIGVVVRGERGSEFELAAREYQTLCGDTSGFPVILSHAEITRESLANLASLERLNAGTPRTFLLPGIDALPAENQIILLEFLRQARRGREQARPLRMVFAVRTTDHLGQTIECSFLEELQFMVPILVDIPPLRDRREDITALARKVLLNLTALFPEYRCRSFHPTTLEWLTGRLWKGNYDEFVQTIREAVIACPSRELNAMQLTKMNEPRPRTPINELGAPRELVLP